MFACPPKSRFLAAFTAAALLVPIAIALAQNAPPPPQGDRVRTVADSLPGSVGGVAVDRLGLIYVADFGEKVWKITPDGRVKVFATGLYGSSGNAIDAEGNLMQSSFNGNYISKIDRDGNVERFADGLTGPVGIAIAPDGDMYVCNCRSNTLSKVTPKGRVTEFAKSDLLNCPNGITFGADSNLYVINFTGGALLKVTMRGKVSEFAQIPGAGGGHVASTRGNLYATSFRGHRVFRVSMEGDVTLLAGTGAIGENNGTALEATFSWPNGIAIGPQGDRLYINDYLNRAPPTLEVPPAPLSSLRQITFASLAALMSSALSGGVDSMEAVYRKWKSDPGTAALFTQVEINFLGYQLMGAGNLTAATRVFELNVESYPNAWNVHDSLGEAYMNGGDNTRAIEHYEKSLELNPANQNGTAMLKKIREGS